MDTCHNVLLHSQTARAGGVSSLCFSRFASGSSFAGVVSHRRWCLGMQFSATPIWEPIDERSGLGFIQRATLAYVDLKPVRAKIASNIATSRYTSVKLRNQQMRKNPERANQPIRPLVGVRSFNLPSISEADYIELVDFTGRELHAGKRGKIAASELKALTKLGLDKNHWTTRVKGIGSGYWRVVGELEELIDKAKEISQRTLFGIGFARILNKI